MSYEVRALNFNQDPLNVWLKKDEEHDRNDTSMELDADVANEDDTSQTDAYDEYENTSNYEQGNRSVNSNQSSADANSHSRYIYVYYTTADETTYNSDLLIDLPGFISSTGGNLGLFLGFSFMGILFSLYEWIGERFLGFNTNNNPTRTIVTKHVSDN